MLFAPLEGWRHVEVTDRHTAVDYAEMLRDLSDTHFAEATKIVLVQDNLNSHKPASLDEPFAAAEARRLVERFEWHYTQARQLFGYGLIRTQRPVHPMPGPAHRGQANSDRGSRCLGVLSQPEARQSRLAIHSRRRSRQAQAALPGNMNDSGQ